MRNTSSNVILFTYRNTQGIKFTYFALQSNLTKNKPQNLPVNHWIFFFKSNKEFKHTKETLNNHSTIKFVI